MVGHELIPNIVEKVGDIDWDKAVDFLRRLVGGVRPDEGLPVADEVASDGAGEKPWRKGVWADDRTPEEQKEWDEYNAADAALQKELEELERLVNRPPRISDSVDTWITYIEDFTKTQRNVIPLLEKRLQEGLDLGMGTGDSYARIQTLNGSIANLEELKTKLSQLNPNSASDEFKSTFILMPAVEGEIERFVTEFTYPQPNRVRVGSVGD